MAKRDPYDVLGVPRNASADDVKSAYRKLARQHHPDVNSNEEASAEKFKEIGEAYSILSDPEKRARFDRFGITDDQPAAEDFFGGAGGGGIGDLFDMFFGATNVGGQRNRGRDGADLKASATVTLSEVVTGVAKEVEVNRMAQCEACHGLGTEGGVQPETCSTCSGQGMVSQIRNTFMGQVRTAAPCPTCGGTGSIIKTPCSVCRGRKVTSQRVTITLDIPSGVENGATMHIPGRGHDGIDGGHPGDLYVLLQVASDKRFERDGQTLYTRFNLTFAQAALGDTVDVECIDAVSTLEVGAGTQPNAEFRVKQGGLPPLHGGRRGDLIAIADIVVPTKLDEIQIDLIKKLAEASGEPVPKGADKVGIFGGIFGKKR